MSFRVLSFAALCLLLTFIFANAAGPESSMKGVIDIDASNADTYLNGDYNAFVEFYAPWCGHCKNLAPEYEKAGLSFDKQKPKDTILAKVNCDEHRTVCSKFGIRGYPTLKFFSKGQTTPKDYTSGRDAGSIVNFINDEAGTRLRVVEPHSFTQALTATSMDTIIGGDKNVLVKFYAPWCGHCKRLAPDYELVAETFAKDSNCVVAKVDADKFRTVAEKYDIRGYPTIKFFKAGSTEPIEYQGGRAPENFIEYLNKACGTSRQLGGGLDSNAGLVSNLDEIASKYSASSDKASLLEEAKTIVSGLSGVEKKSGDYYVKVMEKSVKSGFVQNEIARLQKLKEDGKMVSEQLDWLQVRLNILSQF